MTKNKHVSAHSVPQGVCWCTANGSSSLKKPWNVLKGSVFVDTDLENFRGQIVLLNNHVTEEPCSQAALCWCWISSSPLWNSLGFPPPKKKHPGLLKLLFYRLTCYDFDQMLNATEGLRQAALGLSTAARLPQYARRAGEEPGGTGSSRGRRYDSFPLRQAEGRNRHCRRPAPSQAGHLLASWWISRHCNRAVATQ